MSHSFASEPPIIEKLDLSNSIVEKFNKIDSTINNIEKNNSQIISQAKNNIEMADRILNLQEIIIEFLAVIIAVFGALGVYAFQRVSRTRKELENELNKVKNRWGTMQVEFDNLKKSYHKDRKELRQIIFYLTEGDNSIDAEKFDEAISYYKQALKIRNDDSEVITKLGNTFVRTGDYNKAILYFEEGLKCVPDNISLINGLARALRKSKQYNEAEKYYLQALEIDDNFVWSLSGIGQIYLQKENFSKAEQVYYKLSQIEVSYHAPMNMGILYSCQGKENLSKEYFERALTSIDFRLQKAPNNKWYKSYKVIILSGLKRFDEATEISKKLISSGIFPSSVLSITDRLRVLYKFNPDENLKEMIDLFKSDRD